MAAPRHASLAAPFGQRATSAAHPLTAYLYRLMERKSSNLCLSADVTTARELLLLADRVGPSIVVLKTHYDLVSGWDYNPQTGTAAQLVRLARKHGFLLFEDRKFADIGKTVQQQYTAGTARVVDWAHLVTVNMDAGPAAVSALADAAARWRERVHYEVKTSVSVGTPMHESFHDNDDDNDDDDAVEEEKKDRASGDGGGAGRKRARETSDDTAARDSNPSFFALDPPPTAADRGPTAAADHTEKGLGANLTPPSSGSSATADYARALDGRKGSIVSITTVTQHFEPVDSPRLPRFGAADGSGVAGSGASTAGQGGEGADASGARGSGSSGNAPHSNNIANGTYNGIAAAADDSAFPGIEEPPLDRGILLLAQMSSSGNLMTPAYTQACVEAARAHPGFVAGFIAQQSLNQLPTDSFVHLTPGCKLPPEEDEADSSGDDDDDEKGTGKGALAGGLAGDGLGQQYNTPARLVGERGSDIVIVGRGIITAYDPASEAERYRRKAWRAYLRRLKN